MLFETKAKSEDAQRKALVKHIKTELNIKSRVYKMEWTDSRCYFWTEKPDNRSIVIYWKKTTPITYEYEVNVSKLYL